MTTRLLRSDARTEQYRRPKDPIIIPARETQRQYRARKAARTAA